MLATFIRSIIIYIIVLIVMRLMGKREIGQMQPFELAISIMIADLASIPMTDIGIPISNGIIPILGLLVMHLVISVLNIKSSKIREFICGKPTVLINKGRIDENKMRKERFTLNELEEKLRSNNVMNIGDVEFAILETSGDISVIQKPNKRTTTPEDFNIMPDYEGMTYNLVIDGKILNENLKIIDKNYDWLKKQTQKFQMIPEEALIVTINEKGNIYCQKKENDNKTSKQEKLKEKIKTMEEDWKTINNKTALYIEHEELEKANVSMVKFKRYIQLEEYTEAIAELENCKYILDHIRDKEAMQIINLF